MRLNSTSQFAFEMRECYWLLVRATYVIVKKNDASWLISAVRVVSCWVQLVWWVHRNSHHCHLHHWGRSIDCASFFVSFKFGVLTTFRMVYNCSIMCRKMHCNSTRRKYALDCEPWPACFLVKNDEIGPGTDLGNVCQKNCRINFLHSCTTSVVLSQTWHHFNPPLHI